MTGRDRPFTPKKFRIKPADRIAAARELLRRGFGDLGSRRRLSDITDEANAYDTLHTDLARRMREYSERGTDTVRFLLEVMSDPDPDLEFTIHHRMSAAQELLRRGWDTNYDNSQAQAPSGLLARQGILASIHRSEEDPRHASQPPSTTTTTTTMWTTKPSPKRSEKKKTEKPTHSKSLTLDTGRLEPALSKRSRCPRACPGMNQAAQPLQAPVIPAKAGI